MAKTNEVAAVAKEALGKMVKKMTPDECMKVMPKMMQMMGGKTTYMKEMMGGKTPMQQMKEKTK